VKTLLLKTQLKKSTRNNDGSVNLLFQTMEEIDSDEFLLMDKYWKQAGWLAFKTNEFDGTEMPKENATAEGGQSPSQALRMSLYAKHMTLGGTKEDFLPYYNKAIYGFKKAVDDSFNT
jgi:hypothetical protein